MTETNTNQNLIDLIQPHLNNRQKVIDIINNSPLYSDLNLLPNFIYRFMHLLNSLNKETDRTVAKAQFTAYGQILRNITNGHFNERQTVKLVNHMSSYMFYWEIVPTILDIWYQQREGIHLTQLMNKKNESYKNYSQRLSNLLTNKEEGYLLSINNITDEEMVKGVAQHPTRSHKPGDKIDTQATIGSTRINLNLLRFKG